MTRDEAGIVAAGAALLAVSWAPWYVTEIIGVRVPFSAWDLGLTGLLPVLLALYAAARVLWLRWRPLKPEVPLSPAAEPFVAAALALLVLLFRALDAPGIGAGRTGWLALALAVSLLQMLCAARALVRTGWRA